MNRPLKGSKQLILSHDDHSQARGGVFFCSSMRSQFTFLVYNFNIAPYLGVISFVFVPKPRSHVKVLVDRNWSINSSL